MYVFLTMTRLTALDLVFISTYTTITGSSMIYCITLIVVQETRQGAINSKSAMQLSF